MNATLESEPGTVPQVAPSAEGSAAPSTAGASEATAEAKPADPVEPEREARKFGRFSSRSFSSAFLSAVLRFNVPLKPEQKIGPGDIVSVYSPGVGEGVIIGGPWTDGAFASRWGRCIIGPIACPPFSIRALELVESPKPFNVARHPDLSPEVLEGLARGLTVSLFANREQFEIKSRALQPWAFEAVSQFFGRHPSLPLGWKFTMRAEPGLPGVRWWLRVESCDERRAAPMFQTIDTLELIVNGAVPFVTHGRSLGIAPKQVGERAWKLEIAKAQVWGDGQAPYLSGYLVFPPTNRTVSWDAIASLANEPRPRGMSLEWIDSPYWSIFGGKRDAVRAPRVIDAPPSDVTRAQWIEVIRRDAARLPTGAGLFAIGPHTAAERPGQAGGQPDFAVCALSDVVHAGDPLRLDAVSFSVRGESCRPWAFRNLDGSPVLASKHPRWFCWNHRTHYHPSYDEDRLGKDAGEFHAAQSQNQTEWVGHDPDHESINHMLELALLDGEAEDLRTVGDWIETALAQYPIGSGTYLDSINNPRAVGRTTLAMIGAHVATGRDDILARALDRVEISYVQQCFSRDQLERTFATPEEAQAFAPESVADWGPLAIPRAHAIPDPSLPGGAAIGPNPQDLVDFRRGGIAEAAALSTAPGQRAVASAEAAAVLDSPLFISGVFGPDPRGIADAPSWAPWQEAFVVSGMAALWRHTGSAIALEVARRTARTVTLFGVERRSDGSYMHGGYIRWNADGSPVTREQWADPSFVNVWGDQMSLWFLAAFHVARGFALADGDRDWLAVIDDYLAWADSGSGWADPAIPWRGAIGWDPTDVIRVFRPAASAEDKSTP